MLAATPPMGWNSWNTFGGNIDEDLIVETADSLVASGLRDAGYRYLVVDDVWMAPERKNGRLTHDPERFPSGIAALSAAVHDRGLLFGIYSCAGTHTCEGLPASFGYETVDAQTFAEWEVDYLKYDFCFTAAGSDPIQLYARMGQALRQTGRDIVYSVCEWGTNQPWLWAQSVGAHLWRTTEDILDSWESVHSIGFEQSADLHPYAGPGHWNDPDMLVVGMRGAGHVGRGGLSDAEYRTHFTLWCMQAAPLMIGCDVRAMDDVTSDILLNELCIAVNQDPLGRQGRRLARTQEFGPGEVWMKPLDGGSAAAAFFNLNERDGRLLSVSWEGLGLEPSQSCTVRHAWSGEVVEGVTGSHTVTVDSHDAELIVVTPEG